MSRACMPGRATLTGLWIRAGPAHGGMARMNTLSESLMFGDSQQQRGQSLAPFFRQHCQQSILMFACSCANHRQPGLSFCGEAQRVSATIGRIRTALHRDLRFQLIY